MFIDKKKPYKRSENKGKSNMIDYRFALEEQLSEIKDLIKESESRLKTLERVKLLPVEVLKRNNKYLYYIKEDNKRRYIKGKKLKEVQKIIQKNYELKLNKHLLKMECKLENFLKEYRINDIQGLYENTVEGRRLMLTPLIEPDDAFIERWMNDHPGEQNQYYGVGNYKTQRGEYVRSKSEKIIADMLYANKIPYQYEALLELNGKNIYPDFTILDLKDRTTKYWEHFGIVSDIDYATKNFLRLAEYEACGLELGKDILISQEAENMPLDIAIVERKINKLVCNKG